MTNTNTNNKTLKDKIDCYWQPFIIETVQSRKSYIDFRNKQNLNLSDYNCMKCIPFQQLKCPAYISQKEMGKKDEDVKDVRHYQI